MGITQSSISRLFLLAGCLALGFESVPSAAAAVLTTSQCNQVTFDATESHVPVDGTFGFHWDFGDGTSGTGLVVTHAYAASGDYTVTLSIQDEADPQKKGTKLSHIVRVDAPPPIHFTAPEQGCVQEEIVLDARPVKSTSGIYGARFPDGKEGASGKNTPGLSFAWDFGDGSGAANEPLVRKVYKKGGSYKVVLTVDDNSDSTCHIRSTEKIIRINEPPVAEIGRDIFLKCLEKDEDLTVEFDASKSTDANNDPLTYAWDFGDGTTDMGMKTAHRYVRPGHYEAKLVVNDGTDLGCSLGVAFVTVRLNAPPKAEAGEDVNICLGDEIILDGSASYSERKGTLDGRWVFGDGKEAEGLKVSHRYAQSGVYRANLTVIDQLNPMCPPSSDAKTVTVNAPPLLRAIESAENTCAGDKVQFSALATDSDADVLRYFWNFGDGTVSSEGPAGQAGPRVTHAYAQGGRYRVSLVVDDQKDTSCSSAVTSKYLRVNTPPLADAGVNAACCVNRESVFDAGASVDPDNDSLTYHWDFGDGTGAEGVSVRHTYTKSGSFPVTLTVDDHSVTPCNRATAGFMAVITDTPVPVIRVR